MRERLGSADLTILEEAWIQGDIGLAQWGVLPIWFRLKIATKGQIFKLLGEGFLPQAASEKLAGDTYSRVRHLIANNPHTPPHVLEKLADDEDRDVRLGVAHNPNCSADVRSRLAKDRIVWRLGVEKTFNLSPLALEELAKDASSSIRLSVARNPSTPSYVIGCLANDKDWQVRSAIAERSTCPGNVLVALARDPDYFIRSKVACNPSTPVHVLEDFWRTAEKWFSVDLAQNPSTPTHILEALSRDANYSVRRQLAENSNTPTHVLQTLNQEAGLGVGMRVALASNAHRSFEIFESLRNDPNKDVRCAVLRCKGLSSEALEILFQEAWDEGDWVGLLLNPGLSPKAVNVLLESLFNTPAVDSPWYQHELSLCTEEIRVAAGTGSVLSYPGKHPKKAILSGRALAPLMALCADSFIDMSRLAKVSESPDWLVRAAVARNSGTPAAFLEKLSSDAHRLVSALAGKAATNSRARQIGSEMPSLGVYDIESDFLLAAEEVIARVEEIEPDMSGRISILMAKDEMWSGRLSLSFLVAALDWFGVGCLSFESELNSCLSSSQIRHLWFVGLNSPSDRVRRSVAKLASCPSEILEQLLCDKKFSVRLAALNNPALDLSIRQRVTRSLAESKIEELIILLGLDEVPVDLLEILAASADPVVRQLVARNRHVSIPVLESLARDDVGMVRASVAQNPRTPLNILDCLAVDREMDVRINVAKNDRAPVHVLEILGLESSLDIRLAVAWNPNSPSHVLTALAIDVESVMCSFMDRNSQACLTPIQFLSEHMNDYVRSMNAQNTNAPAHVLEILAKDAVGWTRAAVAANIHTPPYLLEVLAKDHSSVVRRAVAFNLSAPPQVLDLCSRDAHSGVRRNVAGNPNAPIYILAKLVADEDNVVKERVAHNAKVRGFLFPELSRRPDESVGIACSGGIKSFGQQDSPNRYNQSEVEIIRRAVIRETHRQESVVAEEQINITRESLMRALKWLGYFSSKDDSNVLAKASRSNDWLVRLGAALHPNATDTVL